MPEAPGAAGVRGDAAELRAENARLREPARRLRMLAQDKDAKIAELQERIARLERLISRNSGNSSMPPGTDDLPGKKPPQRRTRQGGMKPKPGKQPGAPGAFLAWKEHPDKTGDAFPEGLCPCGADLSDARDLGVKYSHQVTDLPGARAETIQHDRHEVQCACGRIHVADAPPQAGTPGTVTCGLNFQAWCVFLLVMHHVPVERCAGIPAPVSGTRPSDGWVHDQLSGRSNAVNRLCQLLGGGRGQLWGKEYPVLGQAIQQFGVRLGADPLVAADPLRQAGHRPVPQALSQPGLQQRGLAPAGDRDHRHEVAGSEAGQ